MDRAVESGAELAERIDRRLAVAGLLSNGVGGLIVFLFLLLIVPNTIDPDVYDPLLVRNGIAFVVYMTIALPMGMWLVEKRPFMPIAEWLRTEQPAGDEDRQRVLEYPIMWAVKSAPFWGAGAILFPLINLDAGAAIIAGPIVAIVLGGVTACALQYLVVERMMRPVTARALADGVPPQLKVPGVAARLTMAWALATAVPLLGIVALAVVDFAGDGLDHGQLVAATLFLAALALAVGLFAMLVAARSVSEPLAAVRGALERLQQGDFESCTPVDDGSEVGLLQAGFNGMAAGLGERERLREAFGTFVDPHLTERVLEEGTDLAGEEVQLSVMFVDVCDFTPFVERAGAQRVVARLNDLYDLIVPIILRHRGHASKFIGDGLLAVFGAPERLSDHAERAVGAALDIARAVENRFGDELRVGIGVNSGRVVAGTIGGGGRLDFTVIGDPVNTAARVEAATRQTGDTILITEATHALLKDNLATWEPRPAMPLKGKREATGLYAPRAESGAALAGSA